MSINLEDINPQEVEFFLVSKNKSYTLRKITLNDRVWVQDKFKDELENVFLKIDYKGLMQVIYHQLNDDSKKDFLGYEKEIINDDGIPEKKFIKGWEVLSESISSPKEIKEIMESFVKALGLSQPILDKLLEEDKKKQMILNP